MPPARNVKDNYANMIELNLTLDAANTLKFSEIDVGLTLFDKIALLICRIEYEIPDASFSEFAAASDRYTVAISADNSITALNYSTRAIVDMAEIQCAASGTSATLNIMQLPMVRDYTTMPGGGILVAPRPLYLGLDTAGFGAAAAVTMRMYFVVKQLKPEEYFELLESRRFFG